MPVAFDSSVDRLIARGLVGSLWSNPILSRLASWACTEEDDVSPTASPISRTVGG